MELYTLTGTPEYDDDVKEWKVTGKPVRTIWGLVSGSGEWIGGGHRVDGKRRYAVYLHNAGSRKLSITLQFFSNGEPVHEAVVACLRTHLRGYWFTEIDWMNDA